LPTNVEITVGIVALVAALDVILTAALIYINRHELKEAFVRRFTKWDLLKVVICFVAFFVFVQLIMDIGLQLALILIYSVTGVEVVFAQAPAAWVANEFFGVFPIGLFVSTVVTAPVWEEISFRLAGRNIIKNKFLFVVITTILFVFIHTGFAMSTGFSYAFSGIAFAVIYLVTKDIRIVIAVHMLNNLLATIMQVLAG
jgi:membrane protease YdiL (CAAX protease family)